MGRPAIFICLHVIFTSLPGLTHESCFSGRLPFFRAFAGPSTQTTRIFSLETACSELRQPEMHEQRSMAEQIGTELVANMSLPVEGIALSAFDGLDSTPGQRYFKEALRDIKKIADPMERIRRAYALSTAAQGRYDSGGGFDSAVRGLLIRDLTPSNMLEGRRRTGSAGVCRHFAALLNYALLQVSRHENSRSQELGPNDFSARILVGTVPVNNGWADAERHAWVRVHLPQFEGQRLSGFTRFDLDPTRNPESFVPLFPRRSGLTETNRRRLLRQCEEIRRCLELPSGTSHQGFGTDIRGRP